MKKALETLQSNGERELPEWIAENEELQDYLSDQSRSADRTLDPDSAKANRFVKKIAHDTQKLRTAKSRVPLSSFK